MDRRWSTRKRLLQVAAPIAHEKTRREVRNRAVAVESTETARLLTSRSPSAAVSSSEVCK